MCLAMRLTLCKDEGFFLLVSVYVVGVDVITGLAVAAVFVAELNAAVIVAENVSVPITAGVFWSSGCVKGAGRWAVPDFRVLLFQACN